MEKGGGGGGTPRGRRSDSPSDGEVVVGDRGQARDLLHVHPSPVHVHVAPRWHRCQAPLVLGSNCVSETRVRNARGKS